MGEAKRRGSFQDRERQAKEAKELAEIMERKRKEERRLKLKAEFDALSPEDQDTVLRNVEVERQENRRRRQLLTTLLGVSLASGTPFR